MQDALSVETSIVPVIKSQVFQGVNVPWEVCGYREDYATACTAGGFFDLPHWSIIEIRGIDAADYLQRMSTVDIRKLAEGSVAHGAFLTGKGTVIVLGSLWRKSEDRFLFVCPAPVAARAAEHLEQFHFAERLTIQRLDNDLMFGLWGDGPRTRLALDEAPTPLRVASGGLDSVPFQWWRDDAPAGLTWVYASRADFSRLVDSFLKRAVPLLGQHVLEFFRISNGVPQSGIELTEKDIVLEGSFEAAVARNKGCYPGQEVVERIFTYGSVNRRIQKIELQSDAWPGVPAIVRGPDGAEIGELRSLVEYPDRTGVALGLVMLRKSFWGETKPWSYQDLETGKTINARLLPHI
jgi:folate-binding protein YgfZ